MPDTALPPTPLAPERQSWLTTLGWAAYLACSWTWCIGMFLPVLLVRDFGVWGFVVFAVPNVLGAAGMGWVLRSQEAARRIAQEHGGAVSTFTEVTWTFHLFFLCWLLSRNTQVGWVPMAIGVALVLAAIWGLRPETAEARQRTWAMITWCVSAGVAALVLASTTLAPAQVAGELGSDIAFLAPVCAFGFVLCPYLDATFLRARLAQGSKDARGSFTLGFGVLFLAMILLTLAYSTLFTAGSEAVVFGQPQSLVASAVLVHIVMQMTFTLSVHGSAVRTPAGKRFFDGPRGFIAGGVIVATQVLIRATEGTTYGGLAAGEIVYRVFMSFYGLVFPAYVWLCMIPVRGENGTQRPSAAKLRVLAITVALATPCFWIGFIERQTWWLGPGLFIVLVARVFVKPAPAPHTA